MHRRHLPNNNKHYAHKTMCVSTRKWLRAFTAKEIIYTLVEAILLLLCALFLVYLVLHLSVCPTMKKKSCGRSRVTSTEQAEESVNVTWGESLAINNQRRMNEQDGNNNTANVDNDNSEPDTNGTDIFPNATSQRRFNEANYVLISSVAINGTAESQSKTTNTNKKVKQFEAKQFDQNTNHSNSGEEDKMLSVEYSDEEAGPNDTLTPNMKHCKLCEEARLDHERGKCDCGACASNRTARSNPRRTDLTILETKFTDDDDASELHKSLVLALVKAEADDTFTYTCVVTIVSELWTLGDASCVRDLSADTLGLYFLVERFGETSMGSSHGVVEAARGGAGVLALRAGSSLLGRGGRVARLAQPLDHLLLVLGDTFTALGYGKFRSIQARNEDLRLRQTCINWLVEEKCGSPPLRVGQPPFPLCGGVLYGAVSPCYYCGGTPLFLGDMLYGVAGGGKGCGESCPPRRYVTTPDIRDWLDALLQADDAARDGDRELDEYHNDEY